MQNLLITESYRQLSAGLHAERPDFGCGGARHENYIRAVANKYRVRSILDYGCGKGALKRSLGSDFDVREYDPAIPGKDKAPSFADLVVCSDVLEHVEPECIENVLDDLKRVTQKVAFLIVSTVPSMKTLADGRNAHILVRPYTWWLPKLWERMDLVHYQLDKNAGFFALCTKRVDQ